MRPRRSRAPKIMCLLTLSVVVGQLEVAQDAEEPLPANGDCALHFSKTMLAAADLSVAVGMDITEHGGTEPPSPRSTQHHHPCPGAAGCSAGPTLLQRAASYLATLTSSDNIGKPGPARIALPTLLQRAVSFLSTLKSNAKIVEPGPGQIAALSTEVSTEVVSHYGVRYTFMKAAIGFVFLSVVVIMHEVLPRWHMKGTSRRWWLHLVFACHAIFESIQCAVLVSFSFDLAVAIGGNSSRSGLILGCNGLGYAAGTASARVLCSVLDQKYIRQLAIVSPAMIALLYIFLAALFLSNSVHGPQITQSFLGVRLLAGFFQGLSQLFGYVVRSVTPAGEQVRLSIIEYAALVGGIGLGFVLSSTAVMAVRGKHVTSVYEMAAEPLIVVALLSVADSLMLLLLVPRDLKTLAHAEWQDGSSPIAETQVRRESRRFIVLLCAAAVFLTTSVGVGVKVTTFSVLEGGGWEKKDISFSIGLVMFVGALAAVLFLFSRELGHVRNKLVICGLLLVGALGTGLLFRVTSIWQCLAADCLIYASIVPLAAIADGIAFMAVKPESSCSLQNLAFGKKCVIALAELSAVPIVGLLAAKGGHTLYAAAQLAVIGMVALAYWQIMSLTPRVVGSGQGSESCALCTDDQKQPWPRLDPRRCERGNALPKNQDSRKVYRQLEKELLATQTRCCASAIDKRFLMTLQCVIPDFLEIRESVNGKGLFTTRPLRRGELVHMSRFHLIPNQLGHILLQTSCGDYAIDVVTHYFLSRSSGMRKATYFDSFTNHSCNPNVFYTDATWEADHLSGDYAVVARQDIQAGAELTVDYDFLQWDAVDSAIESCWCLESMCRGSIQGFSTWSFEDALSKVGEVEEHVRIPWLQEHSHVLYQQLAPPEGLRIVQMPGQGWGLVAERPFVAGDVLLYGECLRFDASSIRHIVLAVLPLPEDAIELHPFTLVVDVEHSADPSACDHRRFFGFVFCSGSCEANSAIRYTSGEGDGTCALRQRFRLIATKQIDTNEPLSCHAPTAEVPGLGSSADSSSSEWLLSSLADSSVEVFDIYDNTADVGVQVDASLAGG